MADSDTCILKAEVTPSQKNYDEAQSVWLSIKADEKLLTA